MRLAAAGPFSSDRDIGEIGGAYPRGVSIRGRLRDRTQALTLLVCGVALAATAVMAVSRLTLPSMGAYIPTDTWPWTADGVGVRPLTSSSPIQADDELVAIAGRPMADWAADALAPPWFLAPRPMGPVLDVTVRRDGQLLDLQVAVAPFSSERLSGVPLALLVFGGGALIVALVLMLRRPQSTAIRLLFVGVCCNTADIVAWETGLEPGDLVARTPFLYAFAVAAIANLIFWACLVHILSVYPVRAGWLVRRPRWIRLVYAGPIVAFGALAISAAVTSANVLVWFDRLGSIQAAVVSGMLVAILGSIAAGYRRTPAPRRAQVRLLAITLAIAAGATLLLTSLPILLLGRPLAPRTAVALLAIPVIGALAIAVVRDRLFQVDFLATSRRRIIAAREEERLRLRRELHDGLGPTLAALGLKIDRARAEAAAESGAVGPLLDEIRADLRAALAQIRTLSRELRPPGLDALGLVEALRQQVGTIAGPDGPVIELVAGTIGPLPAATEVAAYRIVVEAVTNAVRHSGATHCTVRIDPDGELTVRISDDGVGIIRGATGVGTRSMYERAAEVGGDLMIGAGEDGGTVVEATLPLGPATVGDAAGLDAPARRGDPPETRPISGPAMDQGSAR